MNFFMGNFKVEMLLNSSGIRKLGGKKSLFFNVL